MRDGLFTTNDAINLHFLLTAKSCLEHILFRYILFIKKNVYLLQSTNLPRMSTGAAGSVGTKYPGPCGTGARGYSWDLGINLVASLNLGSSAAFKKEIKMCKFQLRLVMNENVVYLSDNNQSQNGNKELHVL